MAGPRTALDTIDGELGAPRFKALVAGLSERDATGNVPWEEDKTKDGCEIPFTRPFYRYAPPRPLEDIDADLDAFLGRIRTRLEQVKA